MLILSDQDVAANLSMGEAIVAVEKAFQEYQMGKAKMPTRSTIMLPKYRGSISFMPSYLEETDVQATKIISIYPENPKRGLPTTAAWLIVNDPSSGQISAFMEASYLTAMRTGAVTGVAAKYLSREDSCVAAVFGAGIQARTQLMAVTTVRKVEEARVYDLDKTRAQKYSEEMSEKLSIPVKVATDGRAATHDADIILTATTSKTPVIERKWLAEKTHISAIGAFYPDWRELDTQTIQDAKVVIDDWEAMRLEAGDILIPISEGAITEAHIYATLGELVSGSKKGRLEDDGLTVFKSVGLAIQDACVAKAVLTKIRGLLP